jgi:hypothetical protein
MRGKPSGTTTDPAPNCANRKDAHVMKTAIAIGLVSAVILTGTTAATGESNYPDPGHHQTFLLHLDDNTAVFSNLDLGPIGDSPGDEGFAKDVVSNAGGVDVGTMNRTCTLNVPDDPNEVDVLCTGVITLKHRGQIYWQSLTANVGAPPPPPAARHLTSPMAPQWAITGGTGAFRTSRGQITDESTPGAGLTLIRVEIS